MLANLDRDLSWTSELGEAYQNQPDDVMQAMQYHASQGLQRGQSAEYAARAGVRAGADVYIQPADPNVVVCARITTRRMFTDIP